MKYRNLRLGSLIKEELSKLIIRNLEFPDALVTITDVDVDDKLDYAKVKVGILPQNKSDEVMRGLKKEQGSLQHLLNHTLNLKPMPRIDFERDRGGENAANVEKILLDE